MRTSSKVIIALSIVCIGSIGFGIYTLRESQLETERAAQLERKLAQASAVEKRPPSPAPATPPRTSASIGNLMPASGNAGTDVHSRVATLKDIFRRLPEQSIPELRLASESDWYSAVDGPLETESDYRQALAKLRALAEAKFAKALFPALRSYLAANDGRFPQSTAELQSFVGPEIDAAMLQRYQVVPAAYIPNIGVGDTIITQKSPVDTEYDSVTAIGPLGTGMTNASSPLFHQELAVVRPALQAYKAATGQGHTNILQVLPYATTPEQAAIIRKWAQRASERKGP